MKPFLSLLSFLFFVNANGQTQTDVFQDQISRTPFLNWEYVYADSSRAYQDTVEGIERYFWSSKGTVNTQNIIYAYDYESVVNGTLGNDVYRDWNSFDLDSTYAHSMFYQDNPNIGDSILAFKDTILGSSWNEDYEESGFNVVFEEVFIRVEYGFESPLIVISYMKETVDTADYEANLEAALDEPLDEEFDFSGSWIGKVVRYTFDVPADTFLYMERQDSMLQVHFEALDTGGYEMVPDTVWHEGKNWTTTLNFQDGQWNVHARFYDPKWEASNVLVSDDPDSLFYLIVVDPVQVDAYEMELADNEEFGWIWLFYRIKGVKED